MRYLFFIFVMFISIVGHGQTFSPVSFNPTQEIKFTLNVPLSHLEVSTYNPTVTGFYTGVNTSFKFYTRDMGWSLSQQGVFMRLRWDTDFDSTNGITWSNWFDQQGFGSETTVVRNFSTPGNYPMTFEIEIYTLDAWGNKTQSDTRQKMVEMCVAPFPTTVYQDQDSNKIFYWVGSDGILDKPSFLLEGFDPDNTTIPAVNYCLGDTLIDYLRNIGYDIYIMEWKDGGASLATNKDVFLNACQFLRQQLGSTEAPIQVVGISMGGVIGRFGLAWAEDNTPSGPHSGQTIEHYVNTFISFDSPQQGAHVNTGLQNFIKNHGDPDQQAILQSAAAQQMLYFDPYGSSWDYFYDGLRNLNNDSSDGGHGYTNGYPRRCKNFTVSNGTRMANYPQLSTNDYLARLFIYPEIDTWFLATFPAPMMTIDVHVETRDLAPGSTFTYDMRRLSGTSGGKVKSSYVPWLGRLWASWRFHVFFNPSYTLTESGLDLRDYVRTSDSSLVGGSSWFDDTLTQVTARRHEELTTESFNKVVEWITENRTYAYLGKQTDLSYSYASNPQLHNNIININFTDNSLLEDGFIVERKIAGGEFSQIATLARNVTQYTDSDPNLQSFQQYVYRIRSFSSSRVSMPSEEISVYIQPHLVSASSAATSGNNQRKIVSYGANKYLVYVSGGYVWYTAYNGSTWSQEKKISTTANAKNPSLSVYNNDIVNIVWEEVSPPDLHSVMYRQFNSQSQQWSNVINLSNHAEYYAIGEDASPVVGSVGYSGTAYIIWASQVGLVIRYNPLSISTHNELLYSVASDMKLLTPTISDDSYSERSLAFIDVDSSVVYLEFTLNTLTGAPTVTETTIVSGTNYTCKNPTIIKERYSGENEQWIFSRVIAWDAEGGSGRRVFAREWKSSTGWGTIAQIFHESHAGSHPIVGVDMNNNVTILWECGTHLARSTRALSSGSWGSVIDLGQGRGASLAFFGMEGLQAIWTSGISQPYTFNFYLFTVPLQPVLSSPANGVTSVVLSPTLSWNASFDAERYHVQIGTQNPFEAPYTYENTNCMGTSIQLSNLNQNTTYYWRVRAINAFGESEFSPTFSFTTGTPPAAPSLTSPANNALLATEPVTLSWGAVSGAVSYRLQLDLDANFTSPIFKDTAGITGTTCQVSGLTLNTPYYWRVLAVNSFSEGSYSSVRSFKVDPAPSAPYLSWASVTVGNKKYPKLSWTRPATDIQQYKLYRYICLLEEGDCEIGTPHSLIATQTDTSFIDYAVEVFVKSPGHPMPTSTAFYYVKATDNSNQISPQSNKQGVSTEEPEIAWKQGAEELPDETSLIGSFPNPFNPSAEIRYQLSDDEYVTLKVYNTLGEEVATLTDGFESAGYKTRTWDAGGLPSGVYFYKLTAGKYSNMKKMVLAK